MMSARMTLASVLFFVGNTAVNAEGFLKHDPRAVRTLADREGEFRDAMSSVMGCGSSASAALARERFANAEQALAPIWKVLPKNGNGRVEWQMMRYMAHRYFLQKSSLLIRGLEPARALSDSTRSVVDMLSKHAPSLVETALEGRRSSDGFSFENAAALIATMEQVIFDSESQLLGKVYKQQRKSLTQRLNHRGLSKVIEDYMVQWMIGDDPESITVLLGNRTLLAETIPHWSELRHFAGGVVKSMEYSRHIAPTPGNGFGAMTQTYSFDDAHQVVGEITRTFSSYWETECQSIKASLVALDKAGTGRIALSDFYGANADGEWRFGESEEYLRKLGALDESSSWSKKQVIIPNYLQGASNCIVTTSHYFVCCVNECEGILNDIEASVGAPVADVAGVLRPLANMTTNLDDEPLALSGALANQLLRIADTHGGKVPLHGRLFSQWLHYVFPRECPFPHKAGATAAQSPLEFGDNFLVSDEVKNSHASASTVVKTLDEQMVEQDEAQWMSQWIEEEELIVDYSFHLTAPWGPSNTRFCFKTFLLAIVGVALVGFASVNKVSVAVGGVPDCHNKAHFV